MFRYARTRPPPEIKKRKKWQKKKPTKRERRVRGEKEAQKEASLRRSQTDFGGRPEDVMAYLNQK